MKILQVNCVYNTGSTGKIVKDLHEGYQKKAVESIVCYGRGEDFMYYGEHIYKSCREIYSDIQHAKARLSGIMYGGCKLSTNALINIIEKEDPNIVHLHCINGFFVNIYSLLEWLKSNNIPTVLTLHAEFMFTGGCGYALDCEKWKNAPGCGSCPQLKQQTETIFFDRTRLMWKLMGKAFQNFDNLIVVSVSPWLMNRAKKSSILMQKTHRTVYNGLDTSIFHSYHNGHRLKEELRIATQKKVVFHATAQFSADPNHMKGGYYILQLAARRPELQFVIAGSHSITGEIPDNVLLLGKVQNQNRLAELYSMADVTVITSQRETYSMVCAESLSCGTPIVGFFAGGPESISIGEYSRFVQYGDIESLSTAIDEVFKNNWDNSIIERKASNLYSIDRMVESYLNVYDELVGGKGHQ